MTGGNAGPRVIVALDYPDGKKAMGLVRELDPSQCRVKVGKELFTSCGPEIVEALTEAGFDTFLDLKFHDIPNTVARACTAAAGLGVWMMNVHALGGKAMMMAAREAVAAAPRVPLLIAVTLLTSLQNDDLRDLGISGSTESNVLRLADLARECGLDGVVCSAHEARQLRHRTGAQFKLVTPGVRPDGAARDDQKRVMTPAAAIMAGADYLVVGRPITGAREPLEALREINRQIDLAIRRET